MSPSLDVDRLRALLRGSRWGPIDWVASTGSTNADLAAEARAGATAGRVLIAEHQTAGRGRLSRLWETPAGAALALSGLVAPDVPEDTWTWLPLIAGLAVADGLRDVGVADVAVKWPNDVLIDGRKICGILAELVAGPSGPVAVLGMGINVALASSELPVPTATSLLLLGVDASKTDIAATILRALDRWLVRLDSGEPLGRDYERQCSTIGRDVRVETLTGDPIVGTAVGVDAMGRLGVRASGVVRWFAAGDVFHLR